MADEKRSLGFCEGKLELREASKGKKMITGQAIVYERESDAIHGYYVEVIKRGALDNADMSRVVAHTNHDGRQLLGTSWGGTLRMLDTASALEYEVDVPDTTAGRDTSVYMERGDIAGSSFAFIVGDKEGDVVWVDRSEDKLLPLREVYRIKSLHDVSPVTTPAYPDAKSALRNLEGWQEETRAAAQKVADDAKELVDIEQRKLKADGDTLAAINNQLKLKGQ